MPPKRAFTGSARPSKKRKTAVADGSNEAVLLADVTALLASTSLDTAPASPAPLPDLQTPLPLTISTLSSTGDGLALHHNRVYTIPFTAPGDVVLAKPYKHHETHTLTDIVSITTPSPLREGIVPKCKYFSVCGGCQFQHLPYSYQLEHKRHIIEKAYTNFSGLDPQRIPPVGETIASPREYGYRTKLTPHFDAPPNARRDRKAGREVKWDKAPPIGFMQKGTRKTMDIEECPIATAAVQIGLTKERERVQAHLGEFKRGATLLIRESSSLRDSGQEGETPPNAESSHSETVIEDTTLVKTYITDSNATSTEYIDGYRFDNPAGSFFQNNNSILPLVTMYIRSRILTPGVDLLIDAYCGSGFFTITLSQIFSKTLGIDISPQSITSAERNAVLNNLPSTAARFISADANKLFDEVDGFDPEKTAVVIDPPRKGCDVGFMRQLIKFAPQRICYVSCNVHTQARDVGLLVGEGGYQIESLVGFDFFPQTGHVEGVAILQRRAV
ncbi:S-adenosyl-L-methionine-dependent methyltransferase [Piedraia hortae CBS 480.64]|uniref:S-adenosyl-L-methionine-dependent methyltransferase n=1 Tax=Piedraia hortae CBS 480.64 TaxID=1314780 RepID=A0A6A7BQ10_9PEZI|nr:S-adenosyl-L-methionine-dependent methyltransferase [Piedraia hortae CBS 480.64]